MIRFIAAISLTVLLFSCREQDTTLKIDREYRRAVPGAKEPVYRSRETSYKKLHNGFVVGSFYFPARMMTIYGESGGGAADPFTNPEPEDGRQKSLTSQELLEQAGIQFPEGASATYDRQTSTLTATLPEDQMELVNTYFRTGHLHREIQIGIRVEIYELPRLMALQLLESAITEGDHTPERNAAVLAVKNGDAKLVACPSVISRSGQRSRVMSGVELPKKDVDPKSSETENSQQVLREHRPGIFSGTILELDPVLGADDMTINLNFSLQFADQSRSRISDLPTKRELTSSITLQYGNFILIGNWPSKKQGITDTEQVIFITSSIQHVGPYGPMEKVSN